MVTPEVVYGGRKMSEEVVPQVQPAEVGERGEQRGGQTLQTIAFKIETLGEENISQCAVHIFVCSS